MHLSGVDLNLFVVFETIYSERNLTRASEILNITQPAVSNALARLRAAYDDPLFVRVGRTMTPSPLAHNLIGPVRGALRQLRTSIEQGRSFDPLTSEKVFNICVRDNACTELMPGLMARLAVDAPSVRVHCHEIDRRDIAAELASARLDLAIDIPEVARSELNSVPLLADRYVCVLRNGHPLAQSRLDLKTFLAMNHIMVSGRRSGRGFVDIALGRLGHQSNSLLRLTHFQPAFHVAMNTDMVLSAPLSLARKYDVSIKELPFPVPVLEAFLYWHRNADRDPANIWMRGAIATIGGGTMAASE
jgi:DNA-binding transcriptional LysR family regulator